MSKRLLSTVGVFFFIFTGQLMCRHVHAADSVDPVRVDVGVADFLQFQHHEQGRKIIFVNI